MKAKSFARQALVPSPEKLTSLCREWQQRLRLQDWRVRVRYSAMYELDGMQAHVTPTNETKTAVIRINPFAKPENPDQSFAPVECRLIHELVHLHLESVWPKCGKDDLAWTLAEQAVDSLAWALYRAKYQDAVQDAFADSTAV